MARRDAELIANPDDSELISRLNADTVYIDRSTGQLTGANTVERLGLAATRTAASVLRPFHDFGFSYAARLFAAVLPSERTVHIRFPDASIFAFPYGDRYWSVLLPRGRAYAKEIEDALAALADEPFAFVDCGANYGYWSVLLSGERFGRRPTIAVEAAPDTYGWLTRNAAINSGRFATLNRAVSARSGETVQLYGAKHEARSIAGEGAPVAEVETIALDDLLERPELALSERIVLKLDVEGAEEAALEGARRMLDRDVLLVYEEHGSDRSHALSAHLREQLGMRLFAAEAGRVRELSGLAELDSIKRSRRWGYDFFATRSAYWTERLQRLAPGS